MVNYICRVCRRKFKVKKWGNYILGLCFSFGVGAFIPFFDCEKCYAKKCYAKMFVNSKESVK